MKKQTTILSLLSGLLLLVLYTNCSNEGFKATGDYNSVENLFSLGDVRCDPILSKAFDSGIYSFVRTNCKKCHNKGPGQGLFANFDQNIAFATFKNFGYVRLSENAVDKTHARGITGPALQGQINTLNQLWAETKIKYDRCIAYENSSAKSEFDLLTNDIEFRSTDEWAVLSWDLSENNYPENISHTISAKFKVDVQNYYGEGDEKPDKPIGFLFRRPRIEFTGDIDRVYIEGIMLRSEGVPLNNFEIWSQLGVLIDKQPAKNGVTAESIIINDSERSFVYIFEDEFEALGPLSVSFINILDNTDGANGELIPEEPNTIDVQNTKPEITQNITYADLTGTGELAVFRNSCYRCHGNGANEDGFAIDNFSEAVKRLNRIVVRINEPVDPMPKNGRLSLKEIAIIEKWVSDGAPEK